LTLLSSNKRDQFEKSDGIVRGELNGTVKLSDLSLIDENDIVFLFKCLDGLLIMDLPIKGGNSICWIWAMGCWGDKTRQLVASSGVIFADFLIDTAANDFAQCALLFIYIKLPGRLWALKRYVLDSNGWNRNLLVLSACSSYLFSPLREKMERKGTEVLSSRIAS
jgi:hypothetical protein